MCSLEIIKHKNHNQPRECIKGYWFEQLVNFRGKLSVEDHTFASKMNAYCNQLGLDIDLAAGSIGSSVESYQRRTLKKSDTDGIKLEWGNAEGALELIRTIGDKDEPHGVTVLGDEYCEMVCCIDFLEDGADCDPEKQAKIMKTK